MSLFRAFEIIEVTSFVIQLQIYFLNNETGI